MHVYMPTWPGKTFRRDSFCDRYHVYDRSCSVVLISQNQKDLSFRLLRLLSCYGCGNEREEENSQGTRSVFW